MRAILTLLTLLLVVSVCSADPTRIAAFDLGNQLSLAVLGRAGGASDKITGNLVKKAEEKAKTLHVTLPPLPKAGDMAAGIAYLLKDTAPLARQLGDKQGRIFEMALKANVIRLLYTPGNDNGVVALLQDRCKQIGLPDLTEKLRKAVAAKASNEEFATLMGEFLTNLRASL